MKNVYYDDGVCLKYTVNDNYGEGGIEGVYNRKSGILFLRYGSVGDRVVQIHTKVDVNETNTGKIVRCKIMKYTFEDYGEKAIGSFKMYVYYKKRCEITCHILENFVSDIFGPFAELEAHDNYT